MTGTGGVVAKRSWLSSTVLGAILIGAFSTAGDILWFELPLPHRVVYGLAHGTLLFLAIGLYLGALTARPVQGATGGALIGFGAAATFYLLAPFAGYAVMFGIWMGVWVLLALLQQWLAAPSAGRFTVLARGFAAAAGAGLAFYAISGIWRSPPPGGRNYGVHFLSWVVAYLPAFGALLFRRRAGAAPAPGR
jgi:hypothetical protein